MVELKKSLKAIKLISDKDADLIASYFQKEIIRKGSKVINEGRTSRKSYFLKAGIIMCYVIDLKGDIVTTRFFTNSDFFNDYLSFFEQTPSLENYEALTDCILWSIDYDNVQYCFHNIPEFREWGRMLLTKNYAFLNNKMLDFHKKTAEERYTDLHNNYPQIIENVPLNIIASYLGITKFTLSRIRNNRIF